MAVIAQLVAHRSHNPKDVSSILTHRICLNVCRLSLQLSISYRDHVLFVSFSGYVVNSSKATNYTLWGSSPRTVAHETIALTTELREHSCSTCKIWLPRVAQAYACCTSRMMCRQAPPAGFEPAIYGFEARRLVHEAKGAGAAKPHPPCPCGKF